MPSVGSLRGPGARWEVSSLASGAHPHKRRTLCAAGGWFARENGSHPHKHETLYQDSPAAVDSTYIGVGQACIAANPIRGEPPF